MTSSIIDKDIYIDPSNSIDILNRLKELRTLGDVKKLVDDTFPKWIISTMNSYSKDYPHLTENWEKICDISESRKAQVLIVDDITFDDSHTIIKTFCECFTRSGFSVRRKVEFIPCEKCNCAIPTYSMWKEFNKKKNIKIPEKWRSVCVGCV